MRRKETRTRIRFSKELLEPIFRESKNFSDAARKLGYPEYSVKGYSGKLAKKAKLFDIDCGHFCATVHGAAAGKSNEEIFNTDTPYNNVVTRKRLLKLRGNHCENCGISDWAGIQLILDIHHRNQDRTDNRMENLQIICPNCHRIIHQKNKFRNPYTKIKKETA
jgi:hypothetical protein